MVVLRVCSYVSFAANAAKAELPAGDSLVSIDIMHVRVNDNPRWPFLSRELRGLREAISRMKGIKRMSSIVGVFVVTVLSLSSLLSCYLETSHNHNVI